MLRRKFQLCKISVDKQYIEMEFKLTNFIHFNKKHFSIKNKNKEIPFRYKDFSKNSFSIKVNVKDLPNDRLTFDFHYRKRMLWIVAYKNMDNILELNEKIYIVKVNKNLKLTEYNTNFRLVNKNKDVEISQINDECISFNINEEVESLILLNENQQMEIPILSNQLNLASMSQITKKQNYIAYIVLNGKIYRPQFIQNQEVNYLFLNYEWLNNNLNVSIKSLQLPQFDMNSLLNETFIRIKTTIGNIEEDNNYKFESFGLIDADLNNLEYITTKVYN